MASKVHITVMSKHNMMATKGQVAGYTVESQASETSHPNPCTFWSNHNVFKVKPQVMCNEQLWNMRNWEATSNNKRPKVFAG